MPGEEVSPGVENDTQRTALGTGRASILRGGFHPPCLAVFVLAAFGAGDGTRLPAPLRGSCPGVEKTAYLNWRWERGPPSSQCRGFLPRRCGNSFSSVRRWTRRSALAAWKKSPPRLTRVDRPHFRQGSQEYAPPPQVSRLAGLCRSRVLGLPVAACL